jgi:hypothetical protein
MHFHSKARTNSKNRLSSWSDVFLQKIIFDKPLEKLPTFYGTREFITPAGNWTLPWKYHVYLNNPIYAGAG